MPQVSPIRSGLPIELSTRTRLRYPFEQMEAVGDVFWVNRDDNWNDRAVYQSLAASRRYWRSKLPDRDWIILKVSTGYRVQRSA